MKKRCSDVDGKGKTKRRLKGSEGELREKKRN